MAVPIVLVTSWGMPITNTEDATPMTPTDDWGVPCVLVEEGGLPVTLVNEDGTPWEPPA